MTDTETNGRGPDGATWNSEVLSAVTQAIEAKRGEILALSHDIFDHPELAYEEQHAHDVISDALEANGFEVNRQAHGLATAFVARQSNGTGPHIALICEYDALPTIGHACGHNIIAASGFGAALGAAAALDRLGGTLSVIGTPAEEGGGGKIKLLNAGAFEGVDAAMMIHPAGWDLTAMSTIAIHQARATYTGVAAHAAAAPEKGVNALDAAVLGYMNVAALRQHIGGQERIHGVFTNGGDKPNIVPDLAQTLWYVRSQNLVTLGALKERVSAALTAGAIATGADCEIEWLDEPYADMLDNHTLLAIFAERAEALGRPLRQPDVKAMVMGSTDMGNISYAVPSIHPMIASAPEGTAIHTVPFAEHAAGALGDEATMVGAIAMAQTAAQIWSDPALVSSMRADLANDLAAS